MAKQQSIKKQSYPGILVKCESGRFLAYYEHRSDIMASGENEKDAKKNLKKMYKAVMEFEAKEENEKETNDLPPNTKTKKFVEKF
jgi:predicted RNase H-like HicB family nuclease